MKISCEKYKEWVPLYVAGILSEEEREEFLRALKECPELTEELQEWQEVSKAYQSLEKRLMDSVPEAPVFQSRTRLRIILARIMRPPLSYWVVIVGQLMLIVVLLWKIFFTPAYYTLTTPSKKGNRFDVVFKEDAPEREIRRLLLRIGAKIIDGPYPTGVYVITTRKGKGEEVWKALQKSPWVILVEKGSS